MCGTLTNGAKRRGRATKKIKLNKITVHKHEIQNEAMLGVQLVVCVCVVFRSVRSINESRNLMKTYSWMSKDNQQAHRHTHSLHFAILITTNW